MKPENGSFSSSSGEEKVTINTGNSKYSFSPSWLENEGLRGILVGLVSDDLKGHLTDGDGSSAF